MGSGDRRQASAPFPALPHTPGPASETLPWLLSESRPRGHADHQRDTPCADQSTQKYFRATPGGCRPSTAIPTPVPGGGDRRGRPAARLARGSARPGVVGKAADGPGVLRSGGPEPHVHKHGRDAAVHTQWQTFRLWSHLLTQKSIYYVWEELKCNPHPGK